MKKYFIVLSFVALLIFEVSASADNYGCGLGTMIFGKNQKGMSMQTTAATTNQSTATQYFGITSGTSGCEPTGGSASNDRLNRFVASNMDNIARDIARGDGEYLNTLVTLMKVPDSNRKAVNSRLKLNFSKIFTSDDLSHTQVLKNMEKVLKG